MIEVRVVFNDGQESRAWSWADVEAGRRPDLDEIPEWAVEPRKSWPHPQDPIIYSMLVADGRERDALDWLGAL